MEVPDARRFTPIAGPPRPGADMDPSDDRAGPEPLRIEEYPAYPEGTGMAIGSVSEVQTTFERPLELADPGGSQRDGFYGPVAVVPDGPGGEREPPRPRGLIGYDIGEVPPPTPDPFAFSLFEIVGSFDIKGA